MRTLQIAREMSFKHEVWMLDGGRTVPHSVDDVKMLTLPRIHRNNNSLTPLDSDESIETCMTRRRDSLISAMRDFRPDRIVVEHYPFSKWELGIEIGAMLDAAEHANPDVQVVCSIRDLPMQTCHEACEPEAWVEEVLRRLHDSFDGLMVHADPKWVHLESVFPGTNRIHIPVVHTGIVVETPRCNSAMTRALIAQQKGCEKLIVVSAGGGEDAVGLGKITLEAWLRLRREGNLSGYRLILFGGLNTYDQVVDENGVNTENVLQLPFSPNYIEWMSVASLSISCTGYNTCANVLRLTVPAILTPNPAMSDQTARADIMRRIGFHVLTGKELSVENLADLIQQSLIQPAIRSSIDLGGAGKSAEFIARLTNIGVAKQNG